MEPLTERDLLILEVAKLPARQCEQAARARLDVDRTRFHQMLARVVDQPAALVAEPVLVNRLRRLQAERARYRRSLRG